MCLYLSPVDGEVHVWKSKSWTYKLPLLFNLKHWGPKITQTSEKIHSLTLALAYPSLMVMFLSSSFLNLTVCTPEIAFTTVDFPWATWPMVPKREEGGGQNVYQTLQRHRIRSAVSHTDIDGGLSADDLRRERCQGRHVLTKRTIQINDSSCQDRLHQSERRA